MLLKSSFLGTWKHSRWKKCLKHFTTLQQVPKFCHSRIVSTNILITQHVKTGELEAARHLFDGMPFRTVVSWNTMISGYSKWGRYDEALTLASCMHQCNVKLNESTFSKVLSSCAHSGSFCYGKQVHCLVLKSGSDNFDLVGSSLLYFYASCSKIEEAKQVFDELHDTNELLWSLMLVGYVQCNMMSEALDVFTKMPTQDVRAWTTLISGYAKSENGCKRVLELFGWMRSSKVLPNEFTFDCVIRACGRLGVLCAGKVVHGLLIKYGFEFDKSVGGAMIEFYCSCEVIDDAKRVYQNIGNTSSSVSNALIGGLIEVGRIEEAELIFGELTETHPISYNLMIKGYAMSDQIQKSKRLFEQMSTKTIISTNTMISVYSRNGELDKALNLFEETKGERNSVTLEFNDQGKLLHAHLIKTPFESNVYVGTALVDMYSKCGHLTDAQTSFGCIFSPNVAAWTALINGYAYHGLGSKAMSLFESMLDQGVAPNAATFVGVLSACSRAGLVDEGMRIFHSMERCYYVTPTVEHYTCVVVLLGQSGHLKEAEEFIKKMPIQADGVIWVALLNACWFWMDMEMGQSVADKLFNLDPKPTSAYVILSNIYAESGRWGKKLKMRDRLKSLEVKKDPGFSWIELNNRVHMFSVGDRTHPHSNSIYCTLEHITATDSVVRLNCFYNSVEG
ncbi:Pentatricopeptide repeat-containing protein [Quillaja saponaria]|uniref:Pentatricopeptide repeat-containing protein n=1 Tax=Quillaja saponaria TaxID=32244 RepID=A0AAD7LZV5_QUISA|nr:Pentatricopeptide repeat-containing protein [Quillaja saponaria]